VIIYFRPLFAGRLLFFSRILLFVFNARLLKFTSPPDSQGSPPEFLHKWVPPVPFFPLPTAFPAPIIQAPFFPSSLYAFPNFRSLQTLTFAFGVPSAISRSDVNRCILPRMRRAVPFWRSFELSPSLLNFLGPGAFFPHVLAPHAPSKY